MRVWTVVLMLGLVTLAGCSDKGGSDDSEDEEAFDDIDLDADDQTGVIRGVVVDTTISPIAGAAVQLLNQDQETETNENGAFGFSALEPGSYILSVSKIGYETVQSSASVEAGEDRPPILKVQLPAKPGSLPFVAPSTYTGYVACALLVANQLIGAGTCNVAEAFGEDDASHWFTAAARPADYLQTEVNWARNQPGGDRLTITTWACDREGACNSGDNRMCQVWGPSPRICKITQTEGWGNPDGTGGGDGLNETGFGTGTDPGFIVSIGADCADNLCVPGTALGLGVVVQQDFDVFNHAFYNFLPPEDWTFVHDGAPDVPDQ